MSNKVTKPTSIIFNQLWIVKAIEDGNSSFLPSRKTPGISIGEFIEAKYGITPSAEQETPKITKKNSLLFKREIIARAMELGISIPTHRISHKYSLAELLELKIWEYEQLSGMKEREKNKVFQIKMGSEQEWNTK